MDGSREKAVSCGKNYIEVIFSMSISIPNTGRSRNLVFVLLLSIGVISLLAVGPGIERENAALLEDNRKYQEAQQFMQKSSYKEAAPLLTNLLQNHAYSYQIQWLYGLCLAGQGNWEQAGQHMEQARKIRPTLVTDQVFLVQYGEVLYHQGDYSRARRYLNESLKYTDRPDIIPIARQLLQQVEQL